MHLGSENQVRSFPTRMQSAFILSNILFKGSLSLDNNTRVEFASGGALDTELFLNNIWNNDIHHEN